MSGRLILGLCWQRGRLPRRSPAMGHLGESRPIMCRLPLGNRCPGQPSWEPSMICFFGGALIVTPVS